MPTVSEQKAELRKKQKVERDNLKVRHKNDDLYLKNTWNTKINDMKAQKKLAKEQLDSRQSSELASLASRHKAELGAIK